MEKPIQFKNLQGETLTGTLHHPNEETDRGIVLAHCFTCSRHTTILRRLGDVFAQAGFMALRFDFSGNGQSEGAFAQSTFSKQISEIKIAADLLFAKGAIRIGLAGHSMGAVTAVLAAKEIKVAKAVCTIAGRLSGMAATYFLNPPQKDELAQTGSVNFASRGRSLMITTDFFADAGQFDLPEAITSLSLPLLIVRGEKDEIVPASEAQNAYQLNPEKIDLVVVPGADHMFSKKDQREEISAHIVEWFDRRPEMSNRK